MTYLPGQSQVSFEAADNTAIGNTTAEITLLSKTVPGGSLMGKGEVQADIWGSGQTGLLVALPTLTIRVRYGSATLVCTSGVNPATLNVSSDFHLQARLMRSMTTGKVYMAVQVLSQFAPGSSVWLKSGAFTEDASVDQQLSITVQFASLLTLSQASLTPSQIRFRIPS